MELPKSDNYNINWIINNNETIVDQLSAGEQELVINEIGPTEENYPFFEEGIDFLEGILDDHELNYKNLRYPQFKWDDRFLYYYVDNDGRLVIRINQNYIYPEGISSEGL